MLPNEGGGTKHSVLILNKTDLLGRERETALRESVANSSHFDGKHITFCLEERERERKKWGERQ